MACTSLVGRGCSSDAPASRACGSKESTASFKAYQLSKPSEETEAFKLAEQKRKNNAPTSSIRKEETPEETMKRLGMVTYADAASKGKK